MHIRASGAEGIGVAPTIVGVACVQGFAIYLLIFIVYIFVSDVILVLLNKILS
jgi:hypothetical protein